MIKIVSTVAPQQDGRRFDPHQAFLCGVIWEEYFKTTLHFIYCKRFLSRCSNLHILHHSVQWHTVTTVSARVKRSLQHAGNPVWGWNLHRHRLCLLHLHRMKMRRNILDSKHTPAIKAQRSVLTDTRSYGSVNVPIPGDASSVQETHRVSFCSWRTNHVLQYLTWVLCAQQLSTFVHSNVPFGLIYLLIFKTTSLFNLN